MARQFFLFAVVPYLSVMIMLALVQRMLIYHPQRAVAIQPEHCGLPPGRVFNAELETADQLTLHGWHVLPPGQEAQNSADADRSLATADWVLLYFHGNAGNRLLRNDHCVDLAELGLHVFLFDYRGYGINPGKPTEERIAADARSLWKSVRQRGVPPERILIYGESLGG